MIVDENIAANEISPSRLASGRWCHRANKMIGEGDISASYSADRIGSDQPVRKPFKHAGQTWVCVGTGGDQARAYKLVHPDCFDGPTLTYAQRVGDGYKGRRDPTGFYHGMIVKHHGQTFVLCGPETQFTKGTERQGDLFA